MKKTKFLSVLFAILLVLQSCLLPVRADEIDDAAVSEEQTPQEAPDIELPPTDPTAPAAVPSTQGQVLSDVGIEALSSLAGPNDLEVDGEAVLLYELTSGTMVYAKNIDGRREPASLTKVMTALLTLENGDLNQVITVSEEALADMDPDGSSSGLLVGEEFTLEQLLYCLLIESANDAAPVIAIHIAGSEDAFVDMMNAKAQELGCVNTHFSNTHGLHDEQHYTTARDIAKIMLAALEYSKFQEIYSTDRFVMPATNLHDERILVTTNYLIGTAITTDYYDSRVIGGKTGFTTPAGRCITCVAEDNGLRYLCVVLGAKNIVTDDYTSYGSFITASEMFDFGFDGFTFAEVLSPLAPVTQLPVAQTTESVVLTPAEKLTTMLPEDYDPALLRTEYTLKDPNGLTAPLEAGEVVGVVREYYGSICVGETDLVTMTAVARRAFAAATQETVEEIKESPWRFVVIVLSVLLGALVLLFLWSAWIRAKHRRARKRRRRQQR